VIYIGLLLHLVTLVIVSSYVTFVTLGGSRRLKSLEVAEDR
jgi:hypothetical protein